MIGLAFAMAPQPGGGGGQSAAQGGAMQIVMIAIMIGIFYLLIFRPQQKKAKEHRALIDAIKKGDRVVTAGGIHGKVVSVEEKIVTLEVAAGVNIRVTKGFISSVEGKES